MKLQFLVLTALASLTSASPTALDKRAHITGTCSHEQWTFVARALSNCANMGTRAANAALMNPDKMHEYFKIQHDDAHMQLYVKRIFHRVAVGCRLERPTPGVTPIVRVVCHQHYEDPRVNPQGFCTRGHGRYPAYAVTVPQHAASNGRIMSTIYICPQFFDLPVESRRPNAEDQAMVLVREMTRVKSIAGTVQISRSDTMRDIQSLSAENSLRNAGNYGLFAQSVQVEARRIG